jgi:rRNA processing protein Gar1
MLIAVGVVAAIPRPCQKPWCTVRPPAAVNKPLVGVGATLYLTGLVFKARAAEASMRASWWHAAALAR